MAQCLCLLGRKAIWVADMRGGVVQTAKPNGQSADFFQRWNVCGNFWSRQKRKEE